MIAIVIKCDWCDKEIDTNDFHLTDSSATGMLDFCSENCQDEFYNNGE